ncbi:MAG: autotransporter domain-containing protein [Betaproteobacteria bacterium]|nr:autotransporter domain-containing protein [Betaproteobacteria bacterium]
MTQVGFSARSKGLTFGADYRLPGDHVIGVAGGLMKSDTSFVDEGGAQDGSGTVFRSMEATCRLRGYIISIAHAGSNKYVPAAKPGRKRRGWRVPGGRRRARNTPCRVPGYDHNVGPLTLNL